MPEKIFHEIMLKQKGREYPALFRHHGVA